MCFTRLRFIPAKLVEIPLYQEEEGFQIQGVMEKVKILSLILVTIPHPVREKIHECETEGLDPWYVTAAGGGSLRCGSASVMW